MNTAANCRTSLPMMSVSPKLTARKEEQYKQVKQQAELLTKARTKAAREVEKQLAVRLIPLECRMFVSR